MYFGCQCSSARCSRLLSDRLTLLGIFSAEIMTPRDQGHKGLQRTQRPRRCLVSLCILCPPFVLVSFYVRFQSNSGRPCWPYTFSAPLSPTALGRWKIQFCHAVSRP